MKTVRKTKSIILYEDIDIRIKCDIGVKGNVTGKNRIIYKTISNNYNARYYNDNRVKILEQCKEYHQANKEKRNVCSTKHYNENKERHSELGKEYYRTHREQYKISSYKTRARRKLWGAPIPINEWFEECNLHHMHLDGDTTFCMYIPTELHCATWHSHKDIKTMDAINKLAWTWYFNDAANRLDEMYELQYETFKDDQLMEHEEEQNK